MLLESPRATGAARRPSPPVLTARRAALVAAVVLVVTGRGDLWSLAILLGIAGGSMRVAFVVAAAGVATLARVGSAALVDISGAQAVLGAAGFTGSAAGITAAWTSAAALLGVARDRLAASALGAVGGLLVAGPALNGGLRSVAVRVVGLAAGALVGAITTSRGESRRWHLVVDAGVAAAAVAVGILAGYH